MSRIDAMRHRLRNVLRLGAAERQRAEEIAFHQSLAQQQHAHDGADPRSARLRAQREFGNATAVKEEIRHMSALRWLDTIGQDLRYGVRTLVRAPVFALVAILSLALGIGANTAIFGVLHALLLQPLAVPRPQELVALQHVSLEEGPSMTFGDGEYRALRSDSPLPLAAFTYAWVHTIEIAGVVPDRVGEVHLVDGAFFQLLGISAVAGRLLLDDDVARASPVVVVSESMAEEHFGSARAAVGQSVKMNDVVFSIVGVTPRSYKGLNFPGNFALAAPLSAAALRREAPRAPRGSPLWIVGRAAPNAVAATQARVDASYQQCCAAGQYVAAAGRSAAPERATLLDIHRGIPSEKLDLREQYGRVLLAIMGGVAVLLLMACANVGNLLLARATARARELAVRLSLGASRRRLVRQLLIESGLLATLGAAVGLLLAVWGTRALAHYVPPNVIGPIGLLFTVGPHPQLLAFTVGVAVACTGIFGVLPAIRATRCDPIAGLRESGNRGGRRTGRLDRGIVAFQVALALLLVSSAALLVETLRNLRNLEGGFDTVHLLVANIETRNTPYTTLRPHYQEMLRRVNAVPGLRAGAIGSTAPLIHGGGATRSITVPAYERSRGESMVVHTAGVTPNYFNAAGIALKSGRDFTAADGSNSQRVAILSEKVANKYYAGRNPIGTLIQLGDQQPSLAVGVAADVKYFDLRAPAEASVYVPMEQWESWEYLILVAQAEGEPNALTGAMRSALRAALPGVNVRYAQGIAQIIDDRLVRERLAAGLAALFGVLALLLAAVGLYGVMAYQVTARTPEIGVRMALGSRASDAVWLVLRQSLFVAVGGIAIGVPLALGGGRAIATQLYGVTPTHPITLIGSIVALLMVGIFASVGPARRAARVDPLIAIRAE